MTWVVRRSPAPVHRCDRPMREVVYHFPSLSVGPGHGETIEHRELAPDGTLGDLWRCPCGALWRIGDGCDICNRHGPHPGPCRVLVSRNTWRPATAWQKLIHHRNGRKR